jgi:transcriptional regulator
MLPEAIELVQGTLEFLVLKTLSAGDAKHGFDLLRFISGTTGGELTIEEGSLYPALHRMEKRGLIEAEWGLSEKNRKAKFYRITNAGRKQLIRQENNWHRYVAAVDKIAAAVGEA